MKPSLSVLVTLLLSVLCAVLLLLPWRGDVFAQDYSVWLPILETLVGAVGGLWAFQAYLKRKFSDRATALGMLLGVGTAITAALSDAAHPEFALGFLGCTAALFALEALRVDFSWRMVVLFCLAFFLATHASLVNVWLLVVLWMQRPWNLHADASMRIRETLWVAPPVLMLAAAFIDIQQGNLSTFLRFDLRNPVYLMLGYREGIMLYSPLLLFALCLFFPYWKSDRRGAFTLFLAGCVVLLSLMTGLISQKEASYPGAELAGFFPLVIAGLLQSIRHWGADRQWLAVALLVSGLISNVLPLPFLAKWHKQKLNFQQMNRDSFQDIYRKLFAARYTNGHEVKDDKRHRIESIVEKRDFSTEHDYILRNDSNAWYRVNAEFEFSFSNKQQVDEVRSGLSTQMHYRFRYRLVEQPCKNPPLFVVTLENEQGTRNYTAQKLSFRSTTQWQWVDFSYILPEEAFSKDILASYFWNPGGCYLEIDDYEIVKLQFVESDQSEGFFPF